MNISWRPIRFLAALSFCTFLFFSSAFVAFADSHPSQGVTPLKTIEQKSKKTLESKPDDLSEVQAEAKKGINGVQGAADSEKMKNPANAKADATSVEEQVSDVLSNITGKGK